MPSDHKTLFDHLVGAREQADRNLDPHGGGRLNVDHELECRRLDNRKVRWRCAVEDQAGISPDLPVAVARPHSITHQAALEDVVPELIDRRTALPRLESHDALPACVE